jgi:hypothetical protein
MITNDNKLCMAKLLSEREVFKATTFDDLNTDDYLTYNAFEMFNQIVIQEEFSSRIETLTDWLIFDKHTNTIREALEIEDTYLRAGDQEGEAFRDLDCEFIISKSVGNKIITYVEG